MNITVDLNRAISGVLDEAGAEWERKALAAVKKTAKAVKLFTVDDVWERWPDGLTNGSALGAVMRQARTSGWISRTGGFSASNRLATHGRPVPIWYSNLYVSGNLS